MLIKEIPLSDYAEGKIPNLYLPMAGLNTAYKQYFAFILIWPIAVLISLLFNCWWSIVNDIINLRNNFKRIAENKKKNGK